MAEQSPPKKSIKIETEESADHQSDEHQPVDPGDSQETDQAEKTEETESAETEKNAEHLKKQLEAAKQEIDQGHDRLLRLSAEFDNYKKRMNRQMDDLRKYANETLLKDLLSVVDNLERALNSSGEKTGETTTDSLIEGVRMTLNETLKLLSRHQVTPIEALGKPFDPVFHEAVMQEESQEQPENTVINEFQKGYMIHDRLLRPSLVVVSKAKN